MMRTLTTLVIGAIIISCCKKKQEGSQNEDPPTGCFPGSATIRKIVNKLAVVKVTANGYYIAEQGTYDTRLIPCNLANEYVENDLQITISGDVKARQRSDGICCIEDLVITNISR
jgi:hypothetical protein